MATAGIPVERACFMVSQRTSRDIPWWDNGVSDGVLPFPSLPPPRIECPVKRFAVAPMVAVLVALGGCGGSSAATTSAAPPSAGVSAAPAVSAASSAGAAQGTASSASPAATSSSSDATCPTDNTRSFAKTRFVADLGGAVFLVRRYVYTPYTQGKFKKGASGRTFALIKAAAAVTASTKLLKNASENAKANPTLCKTVAGPISKVTTALSGLTGLGSGSFNPAALAGLGGGLGSILGAASQAGINVQEKSTSLG